MLSSGHRLLNGVVLFRLPLSDAFCEMFHRALPQALGLCSSDFPPVPQSSSFSLPARIPSPQYLSWNSSVAQSSPLTCLHHLAFSQVPATGVFHTESCSPHTPIFTAPWMPFPLFFYLHCAVCCAAPWLPLSFPQCLPFNFFRGGGSELLSAPSLEKHCSL